MLRIFPAVPIIFFALVAGAAESTPTPAVVAPPEATHRSVAVFDIRAKIGIEQASVDIFGELLQARLRNELGFRVIGRSDIESMLGLQAMKQAVDCDDSQCLAQIGGALGVDEMVTGSIAKLGTTLVISLKRVDPSAAKVLGQATREVREASDDAMLDAVMPLVVDLYPEAASRVALGSGSSDRDDDADTGLQIRFGVSGGALIDVTDLKDSSTLTIGLWIEPHPRVQFEITYLVSDLWFVSTIRGWLLELPHVRIGPTVDLIIFNGLKGIGVGAAVDVGTRFKWIWLGARLEAKVIYHLQWRDIIAPVALSLNVGLAP